MKRVLFFFSLIICFSFSSQAQEKKKIEIKYSGFLSSNEKNDLGGVVFLRDKKKQIHIVHDGADMYCDKAILYKDLNFIEAFSNVKMVQGDTVSLKSKYIRFNGDTEIALARGNVVLKEPKSTLTTDTLYFDKLNQKAFYKCNGKVVKDTTGVITSRIGRYSIESSKYEFVENVKVVNENYVLTSSKLDFYSNSSHLYMYGPSTITSEENTIYCEKGFYNTNLDKGYFVKNSKINYEQREIIGDSIYFDRFKNFASATNNIVVTDTINKSIIKGHYAEVFKDKDSLFITKRALAINIQEQDSLYLHADTLLITGPSDARITRAFKKVKIFKKDLSGKCDSLYTDEIEKITKLINISKTNDVFAKKRFPVLWNQKNQITGDTIHLIGNRETNKLDSLLVFNNAFLVSKDTLGTGYNQIKGKTLTGFFKDNEFSKAVFNKNAEVIYYFRDSEDELVGINKSKSGKIEVNIEENTIEEIELINDVNGTLYPEKDFPEKFYFFKGFNWREEEKPHSVEDLFIEDEELILPKIKGIEDKPSFYIFSKEVLNRIKKDPLFEKEQAEIKKNNRLLQFQKRQKKASK